MPIQNYSVFTPGNPVKRAKPCQRPAPGDSKFLSEFVDSIGQSGISGCEKQSGSHTQQEPSFSAGFWPPIRNGRQWSCQTVRRSVLVSRNPQFSRCGECKSGRGFRGVPWRMFGSWRRPPDLRKPINRDQVMVEKGCQIIRLERSLSL